jgi:hypothetical protein
MKISDDLQLKEIKAKFKIKFPHLRLEFFSEEHGVGEASSYNSKFEDDIYLKDIRVIHNEGDLAIDGQTLTGDFETGFKSLFGVNVQVLRKSGNMWLQTTTTDRWSLNEQEAESIKHGLFK